MHQGFGSLLDLGAGVRVPRCIAGGATGIQIKTRKSLVYGLNTPRGDAQVGDSKTHAMSGLAAASLRTATRPAMHPRGPAHADYEPEDRWLVCRLPRLLVQWRTLGEHRARERPGG